MKRIILIAVTLLIAYTFSAQTKKTPLAKEFYACWKSSYEENDDNTKTQIYKPCSSEFKPSMFRLDIEFFSNGKCKYLHAGPTDNHYYVNGKWSYNSKTRVVTVLDSKKKLAYKFKINEVNKEVLKTTSLL